MKFLLSVLVVLSVWPTHVQAWPEDDEGRAILPPLEVNYSGGPVCLSPECMGMVTSMPTLEAEVDELGQDEIDLGLFCEFHYSIKPPNCDADDPPSAPGFDANWTANGCGSSWWDAVALNLVFQNVPEYEGYFTGSINGPFVGVSFEGACDSHDFCYGFAGQGAQTRSQCDNVFNNDMQSACAGAGLTGNGLDVCNSMANGYFGAVQDYGEGAFDDAREEYACALWHSERELSGCP